MAVSVKARSPKITPRKRKAVRRTPARTTRERSTTYRTPRWKIPDVTPIGSDAPVSKTLPRAVKRIAETLHPEKIILFGSYAYGIPTPDSDVDLLVVMETKEPRIERYLAVSRCLRPRPFAVDIIVKTPQEIQIAIEQGDFFIEEIYTKGKVLHEPSPRPA